jgi:hypothetical protein
MSIEALQRMRPRLRFRANAKRDGGAAAAEARGASRLSRNRNSLRMSKSGLYDKVSAKLSKEVRYR